MGQDRDGALAGGGQARHVRLQGQGLVQQHGSPSGRRTASGRRRKKGVFDVTDGYVQQMILKFTMKYPNLKKKDDSLSGLNTCSSGGPYSGIETRKRKGFQMDGPRSPVKRIRPDEHLSELN